jgi:hypothetical protein
VVGECASRKARYSHFGIHFLHGPFEFKKDFIAKRTQFAFPFRVVPNRWNLIGTSTEAYRKGTPLVGCDQEENGLPKTPGGAEAGEQERFGEQVEFRGVRSLFSYCSRITCTSACNVILRVPRVESRFFSSAHRGLR